MNIIGNIGGALIGIIASLFIIALVLALPLMWLWNSTIPELFNLPVLGFWAALKINIITGILFRSSISSSD